MTILLTSACGTTQETTVFEQVEKPELVLPELSPLNLKPIKWEVLTSENQKEKFENHDVYFALSKEGYESLALNHLDISEYIQQLFVVINAYEQYYGEE